MNAVLSSTPGRHDHPPQSTHPSQSTPESRPIQDRPSHPVRRVSIVDRAALHLGLALIRWGRRPLELESRERRVVRFEEHTARLERERQWQRWQILNLPHR